MKRLILAILMILPIRAVAGEIALGLITAHIINEPGVSQRFSGCVNPGCEIITNPVIAYRGVLKAPYQQYLAGTLLAGVNSVHQPIVGAFGTLGQIYGHNHVGMALGFYLQDNDKFRERRIAPFTIGEVGKVGFVPIFGMEHQYRFTKRFFSNTLITPAIANFGVGFSW